MKHQTLLFLALMFISVFPVEAQKGKNHKSTASPEKVTLNVDFKDEIPKFLGGENCLSCYLSSVIRYPDSLSSTGICGTVLVEFTVEKTGAVRFASAKVPLYPTLDTEAVRGVLSTSGMWTPGYNMGIPVRCFFQVPITFQCPSDSEKSVPIYCPCYISEAYTYKTPKNNGDTIVFPVYYELAQHNLRATDSLALSQALDRMPKDGLIEVHLHLYESNEMSAYTYVSRGEKLVEMVNQRKDLRSAMVFIHYELADEVRYQELSQHPATYIEVRLHKF